MGEEDAVGYHVIKGLLVIDGGKLFTGEWATAWNCLSVWSSLHRQLQPAQMSNVNNSRDENIKFTD